MLPFLTNQVTYSHVVIWVAFILLGIYFFYHSFCLHDFKIIVKSIHGKGVPFHVLALFFCCQHSAEPEVFFLSNDQSFTFWTWLEEFWIWFIHISNYNTVQLRWDNIEINNQNKCCHEGARPHQKVKIPKIQR